MSRHVKTLWYAVLLSFSVTGNVLGFKDDTIEVDLLARSSESWNGSTLPAYPEGQPQVTILRITIPPKFQLPLHKHPVINAGVLLSGELTVFSKENETLHLEAGDSIVEMVDRWHFGRNDGTEPAEIIVFYAGVRGTPLSVTEPKGQ